MSRQSFNRIIIWLFLLPLLFRAAAAGAADTVGSLAPVEAADITEASSQEWISEKVGDYLPLDAVFVDEHGVEHTLGSLIDRPTLILPIYFYCPSSCSMNLANMAVALNRLNAEPGRDYRAIALSFSETETPDNARRAKQNYLKLVRDEFPAEEWKFLTGNAAAIKDATEAMGYRFKKMADGTYIHPSALVVADAEGRIIRYVYGSFIAGDIDLAIAGAREGVPMLSVKRLLDFCFNYDPNQNNPWFFSVKIAVLVFFGSGVGLLLYFSRRRSARHRVRNIETPSPQQDKKI